MTFTEAAIEVLRRAGKPLPIKDIAGEAVGAGLLSHVGQTPEETMGVRLTALAKREQDRRVVALEPGVFALAEWGLLPTVATITVTPAPEASAESPSVADEAPIPAAPVEPELLYRHRERHPPLREEMLVGGRHDDRRRGGDDDGHRRKRYGPPADSAWTWLREHGNSAQLADISKALRETDRIAEALERDPASFQRALEEENKRRADGKRPALFEFGPDGSITALEQPARQEPNRRPDRNERPERQDRQQQNKQRRPVRPEDVALVAPAADEQRKAVLRSIRRRVVSLEGASLERVVVALLEAQGFRDMNMVRRSTREGPLYLARHHFGAAELRYVVRVLQPGRSIGREDVQAARHDVSRYSSQMAVLIGNGDCVREARSEANLTNEAPVLLYGGEALAEALADAGFGATKRLIEWLEYDDEFFVSAGAGDSLPDVAESEPPPLAPDEQGPSNAGEAAKTEESGDRGRDHRRSRRRRDGGRDGGGREGPRSVPPAAPVSVASEAAPAPIEAGEQAAPVEVAPSAPVEAATVPEVGSAVERPPETPSEPLPDSAPPAPTE